MTLLVFGLCGCTSLPSLEHRLPSQALTDTANTRLGEKITPKTAVHVGQSGFLPLFEPIEAFEARIVLASQADRSLDVQYYIWHGDTTGYLLFEALWQAAERGVRVRLLLDDNNTQGLDSTISALDSHPNIEVRLFNPIVHRQHRLIDYLTDFSRINRRMHNKSMTADNQATIVGSRNIGDNYFAANDDMAFADLDVVAVGNVVGEVSQEFDRYWSSQSAYPADRLIKKANSTAIAALLEKFKSTRASPAATKYIEAIKVSKLRERFRAEELLPYDWCVAKTFYDDPAKVLHSADSKDYRMWPRLKQAMGEPRKSIDIVSPYFVPSKKAATVFEEQARKGIKIRILTNSLAATDVALVHAGYAKYRKALLTAGVRLFELKPTAWQIATRRRRDQAKDRPAIFGHSTASLHAKTFALDDERIFIGSFNMDPRSLALNTEIGILLESPKFARELNNSFDNMIPLYAYEVRLTSPGGRPEWIEHQADGDDTYFDTEPQTSFFERMGVNLMAILPIDWLL